MDELVTWKITPICVYVEIQVPNQFSCKIFFWTFQTFNLCFSLESCLHKLNIKQNQNIQIFPIGSVKVLNWISNSDTLLTANVYIWWSQEDKRWGGRLVHIIGLNFLTRTHLKLFTVAQLLKLYGHALIKLMNILTCEISLMSRMNTLQQIITRLYHQINLYVNSYSMFVMLQLVACYLQLYRISIYLFLFCSDR